MNYARSQSLMYLTEAGCISTLTLRTTDYQYQDVLQAIVGTTGIVLFTVFLVLLALYLWFAFQDIVVVLKNYNFRRAMYCRWDVCGLYEHEEEDPQSKACLNPFVSPCRFDELSEGGNHPGCRHSIQVREVDVTRRPASEYREEFMERYSAFHPAKNWWKVATIFGGIAFWALGVVGLLDFVKLLF